MGALKFIGGNSQRIGAAMESAVRSVVNSRPLAEGLQRDWVPWARLHGDNLGRVGKRATTLAVAELIADMGIAGLRKKDGVENTVRHVFWSGLLTQRFSKYGNVGIDEARMLTATWTDVHERMGGDGVVDSLVDVLNNYAGATIGAKLVADGRSALPYSRVRKEMMRDVISAWDRGELAYWSATDANGSVLRTTRPEDLSAILRQRLMA